jgi:5-hydroxyisourate hydrolase
MSLTTHVLDTARGRPAAGLRVQVERLADGSAAGTGAAGDHGERWDVVGGGTTDADGRVPGLLPEGAQRAGVHRITFATGEWLAQQGLPGFYPWVVIVAAIDDPSAHCHVPLLLSPFGYSTYRGS